MTLKVCIFHFTKVESILAIVKVIDARVENLKLLLESIFNMTIRILIQIKPLSHVYPSSYTQGVPLNMSQDTGCSIKYMSTLIYWVFLGISFKIQGVPLNMSQDTGCSI